jgi:hypothetical protein
MRRPTPSIPAALSYIDSTPLAILSVPQIPTFRARATGDNPAQNPNFKDALEYTTGHKAKGQAASCAKKNRPTFQKKQPCSPEYIAAYPSTPGLSDIWCSGAGGSRGATRMRLSVAGSRLVLLVEEGCGAA